MYFLLDLVEEPDLSEILIPAQAKDPRGEKGFYPRMMTMLLLYAYSVGTVSLGHVPLDGTKVKANASKHKAMSHERILRAEKQLAQEINALMHKAEILDVQEDRR